MRDSELLLDVRRLFNLKASTWGSKYRGSSGLSWRLDTFVEALASRVPSSARVLDFGCGTGDLAARLADVSYQVTACDIADGMLSEARKSFGDKQIEWTLTDGATLPYPDGSFDALTASSALEYVPDLDAVLQEFLRVVRAGGIVAATVPNLKHPTRRLEGVLRAVARFRPVFGLLALRPRTRAYVQYLMLSRNRLLPQQWAAWANAHGFEQIEARTAGPTGTMLLLIFRRE
jgi:ubiquinone/menaquinone biosynthesis C-methylase UbiE